MYSFQMSIAWVNADAWCELGFYSAQIINAKQYFCCIKSVLVSYIIPVANLISVVHLIGGSLESP